MSLHTATRKAWGSIDGKRLVACGDALAAVLICGKGHSLTSDALARFANADEFFGGYAVKPPEYPYADAEPKAEEPKAKRSKS